jgi:hypothetical protein
MKFGLLLSRARFALWTGGTGGIGNLAPRISGSASAWILEGLENPIA